MRIFTGEPLSVVRHRWRDSLRQEGGLDENLYEDAWLPFGDDKEIDIQRLISQNRIHK